MSAAWRGRFAALFFIFFLLEEEKRVNNTCAPVGKKTRIFKQTFGLNTIAHGAASCYKHVPTGENRPCLVGGSVKTYSEARAGNDEHGCTPPLVKQNDGRAERGTYSIRRLRLYTLMCMYINRTTNKPYSAGTFAKRRTAIHKTVGFNFV